MVRVIVSVIFSFFYSFGAIRYGMKKYSIKQMKSVTKNKPNLLPSMTPFSKRYKESISVKPSLP